MPRKPKSGAAHDAAYGVALRLHAAAEDDPALAAEPPVERPGGVYGANAAFTIRDTEGRVFTVIVARQH